MIKKAKRGRNVFGKGRDNIRGITTSTIKTIKGYKAKGRTNVLPPTPEGKYGKLVTGKNNKNSAQNVF
jgi:hypothetical protein